MKRTPELNPLFRRILPLVAALVICVAIFCVVSTGSEKIKIYFYSSETSINNFKSLKMEFDRYLSRFGPYEFQPFSSRDAFEKHVKGKENCLLLLSSWHYRHIHRAYSLMPALTGVRNGSKYQSRVLVAGKKATGIEAVKTGRIASASSPQHTASTLRDMLRAEYAEKPFRILTVPKDLDALMSVGLGSAKLALASRNCLDELKALHPPLGRKIRVLAEGKESLLLILAVPTRFTPETRKIVDIMKAMPGDSNGMKKIRMLGLDAWQELEPDDRAKLES
ncbi:MAG: hypothetical protein JRK53_08075 [Deltaproteobacteria bacterium]|nr:hypothetical protein [Deltaproteobacteria bacterium]